MRNSVNSLFIILIIACLSFRGLSEKQFQTENELIIGSWMPEGSSNSKRVFEPDGKCYDYYKNILETTYVWSIESSQTQSGLVFKTLKLCNVENSNEVYNYELSIGNDTLQLFWSERPSKELIYIRINE